MAGLQKARSATQLALVVAFIVLSGVILVASARLVHQDGLDASINVNWPVWWSCVAGSYFGLGLIGSWAVRRDLQRLGDDRAEPVALTITPPE